MAISQSHAANYVKELTNGRSLKRKDISGNTFEIQKRIKALNEYGDTLTNAAQTTRFFTRLTALENKYAIASEAASTRETVVNETSRVIKVLSAKIDGLNTKGAVVADDEVAANDKQLAANAGVTDDELAANEKQLAANEVMADDELAANEVVANDDDGSSSDSSYSSYSSASSQEKEVVAEKAEEEKDVKKELAKLKKEAKTERGRGAA